MLTLIRMCVVGGLCLAAVGLSTARTPDEDDAYIPFPPVYRVCNTDYYCKGTSESGCNFTTGLGRRCGLTFTDSTCVESASESQGGPFLCGGKDANDQACYYQVIGCKNQIVQPDPQ